MTVTDLIDQIIKTKKAEGRFIASASQVEWFLSCQRKWGFKYLDKREAPPNEYAKLGSRVHKILENWLRHGTPPDRNTVEGAIALSGIKHLPAPGEATIEGRFLWEFPNEPFDLQGVIDWAQPELAKFGDHKTTGDFKWALTPEDLVQDIQATTYAAYMLYKLDLDAIEGRWVYYRTKGRRGSKCVDWATDWTKIEAPLNRILTACRAMAVLHRQKPKAKELPYEAKACDNYGGCIFRETCNLSSTERLVSLMAHETLKEKMTRKRAEREAMKAGESPINPPEAPAQVAAPPPAQVAAEAPPSTPTAGAAQEATAPLSLKEKMQARKAEAEAPPPPVAVAPPPQIAVAPQADGAPVPPAKVVLPKAEAAPDVLHTHKAVVAEIPSAHIAATMLRGMAEALTASAEALEKR